MSKRNNQEKNNIQNLNQSSIDIKFYIQQLKELSENYNKDNSEHIKLTIKHAFEYILNNKSIYNIQSFDKYFTQILDCINEFINKKDIDISLTLLKEVNFLISNLKLEKILNILYSKKYTNFKNENEFMMNILDRLISIEVEESEEEFINQQAVLMKTLVLKLNDKNILYFYNPEINQFPILDKALYLYDYPDGMIKGMAENTLLIITKIQNTQLTCYLTSFPIALYYPIIIYNFKDVIEQLNTNSIGRNVNLFEYLEEKHGKLFDSILYINDILSCKFKNINFVIYNCLLNEIIFPLFNIIRNKKKEKISKIHAIYILSFFIFFIKDIFIIDLISYFLFQENIPQVLFDKIKKYIYKQNRPKFIKDINFLIKNTNEADINDDEWKRNADFIKNDIGIDLYTGIIIEDNNFHFFKNFFKDIKSKKDPSIVFIQNEIFKSFREILNTNDDNTILNTSLLIFNVINYYLKYFENYDEISQQNELDDEDGNLIKNKMRKTNTEINNLRKISKINNNKNQSFINNDKTIFNPFLLPFFSISENKTSDDNLSLFDIFLNFFKNKKKFRVCTNEIILNIIELLIKIYFMKHKVSSKESDNIKTKITSPLKEEINKIKKLIEDKVCRDNSYQISLSAYEYYKLNRIDKIKDLMKLYYILVPSTHLDKNDIIPFQLKEDKTKINELKNHLINILFFVDILEYIKSDKKNDEINGNENKSKSDKKFGPFEVEKDIEFEIGKIYEKKNLGKEYAFCFISNEFKDFRDNFKNIKKCVFILSKYNFYLGEIESKTFKDLSKIKIFFHIPLRFLSAQVPINGNDSFLELTNIRNEDKNSNTIIMNCFDSQNAKKTYNYLSHMINNAILLEKSLFDKFFENIENKCS